MKKRRVGAAFHYRDCDAFAGYLHEQSMLGWHFKEFRLGLVFEHGEPADMYYVVLLLASAVFLGYSRDEYFLLYALTSGITLISILLAALWVAFRRPSRNGNRGFQLGAGLGICFCFIFVMTAIITGRDSCDEAALENAGDFPLIQADYRQIDGEITSAHADSMKSVLGSAEHFYVDYYIEASGEPGSESGSDSLWYTVYRSPHSWILDKLWKDELSKLAERPEDRTEAWNAVSAASQAGENRVCKELVRYPDSILVIRTDERPDDSQIRMICEKLMM